MSLDGVWVLEVAGVYGWERVSSVFLEKGRYLGGGAFFFSQGSYVGKGDNVKFSLNVTRHGRERTIFGEKRKKFSTVIKAKAGKDIINGYACLKGAHSSTAKYPVRLLRQTELVKFPKKG
jgi:hypothetical protein